MHGKKSTREDIDASGNTNTHTHKLHTALPREQLGCRAVFRGRQVVVRRHINCHFLLCQWSNSLLKVWPFTPRSPTNWAAHRRCREVITNDSAVSGARGCCATFTLDHLHHFSRERMCLKQLQTGCTLSDSIVGLRMGIEMTSRCIFNSVVIKLNWNCVQK